MERQVLYLITDSQPLVESFAAKLAGCSYAALPHGFCGELKPTIVCSKAAYDHFFSCPGVLSPSATVRVYRNEEAVLALEKSLSECRDEVEAWKISHEMNGTTARGTSGALNQQSEIKALQCVVGNYEKSIETLEARVTYLTSALKTVTANEKTLCARLEEAHKQQGESRKVASAARPPSKCWRLQIFYPAGWRRSGENRQEFYFATEAAMRKSMDTMLRAVSVFFDDSPTKIMFSGEEIDLLQEDMCRLSANNPLFMSEDGKLVNRPIDVAVIGPPQSASEKREDSDEGDKMRINLVGLCVVCGLSATDFVKNTKGEIVVSYCSICLERKPTTEILAQ